MAKVTFDLEIPDVAVAAIVKDFTDFHGYQTTVIDESGNEVANPQSRAVFAKECVINFIKSSVKTRRAREAARIAQEQALKEVTETEIT